MKRQFVNDPEQMTTEALEGLELVHPDLVTYRPEAGIVTRARPAEDKVGLVSGGGSGHEPLHAGFVGTGMLDVAVPGAVFASPTALQVHEGTRAADGGRGVLQIVKNYTGDVLNFGIGRELAEDDGIEIASVLVDDDLSTQDEHPGDETAAGRPGRRGTAAVVAVEKCCGAAAEAGAPLDEVAAIGTRVAAGARTMSLALEAGTRPGDDRPAFELDPGEVEFGVGIHGERGRSRVPFAGADELARMLVQPLLDELAPAAGSRLLAIVNGLGSTYPLELQLMARAVYRILGQQGMGIERALVGSYVTSLDMHGISVTLLALDDELVRLWDAPVRTPALHW